MKLPIVCNVKDLFMNIKCHIEMVDVLGGKGLSVRVKDIKMHDNNYSRDLACEFLFCIINNEIINEDKPYLYNIIYFNTF